MSGNFFHKVERFITNLIIITLIILISVQIMMKNETAHQRIQYFESRIRGFFQPEEIVEVAGLDTQNSGFITIDLLQDLSLPQVWLVKNGQRVTSFSRGIITIQVKEGDLLVLDTSNYPQPLWFEITSLSPSIKSWQIGQQFRTNGQEKNIGVVQFQDKL